MTRDEFSNLRNAYLAKFGSDPGHPSLDLGHASLSLDEDAAYMQAAIDLGQPIKGSKIFPPLPKGCLS